jgi:hypothetical protein
MTGKSLRSEHALREKVIEARIAEQELSITKSRSEVRKLGNEKLVVDSAPLRVPDAVRNVGSSPAAAASKPKPTKKAVPAKTIADAPAAAPYRPTDTPPVCWRDGSRRAKVAMVAYQGRVIAVRRAPRSTVSV